MHLDELGRFDLVFPGHWIAGTDRDWAWKTASILSFIEDEFIRAVTSCAMFQPGTAHNVDALWRKQESKYRRCLGDIYARSFVFSLDAICKQLEALQQHLNPPTTVLGLVRQYVNIFGHLKHIRDSIAHLEDRGRGVDKDEQRIPSNLLVLGGFNERQYMYTGSDGKIYVIEISESTLTSAQRILQSIVNAYTWE